MGLQVDVQRPYRTDPVHIRIKRPSYGELSSPDKKVLA